MRTNEPPPSDKSDKNIQTFMKVGNNHGDLRASCSADFAEDFVEKNRDFFVSLFAATCKTRKIEITKDNTFIWRAALIAGAALLMNEFLSGDITVTETLKQVSHEDTV
jgi:hypothetical protein